MVASTSGSRLKSRSVGPVVLALALVCPLFAQTDHTLAEVTRRQGPDFTPVLVNQAVRVHGVVNSTVFHFPDYSLLSIQDVKNGVVLQVPQPDKRLDILHPGDDIEVEGTVASLFGAVAVLPTKISITGRATPPAPISIPVEELLSTRYLGRLVRTEARIRRVDETTAGSMLDVDTPKGNYRVFLPSAPRQRAPDLSRLLSPGDRVQITGIGHQYCTRPPYDRFFELLVSDPTQLVRTEKGWGVSPLLPAGIVGLVLLIGLFFWNRERSLRGQRARLRQTFQLGEEILGASSSQAILHRITEALPGIIGVTRARLYAHDRAAKTLEEVVEEHGQPVSIPLSSPPGGTQAGAVACFHYRTLLVIPDIDRSPFPRASKGTESAPKSMLFVPMLAQGEVAGVLELDQDDRVRDFTADEQALAQHLGNQIGVALRLLDQRSVQEQLFRTEKLAAVGRLISGIVNELQAPLASISELASHALIKPQGATDREVGAIAAEAQKASAIVARMVSFATAEQGEARPVSITALLRSLIEFRASEWKASGIRVRDLTSQEPLLVLGSQGQLEQVFLNLLVHAEQSLADAPQKTITIRTSLLAKRLLLEIAFSASPLSRKPGETASVLSVTRSVVAGHGGEVRLIEKANAEPRFEIELPAAPKERAPAAAAPRTSSRSMTALVIEPDEASQRQLLALLSTRGCRVVPVGDSDTGLDLAHRLRFDVVFCSIHAPGLNWVELSERMHSRVGGFVLLSDGYNSELSADFEGDGCFVLPKPVQEPELDRVLQSVEPRGAEVIPITRSGVA